MNCDIPPEAMETGHSAWTEEHLAQWESDFDRLMQEMMNPYPSIPPKASFVLDQPPILSVLLSFFPVHEQHLRQVSRSWDMVFQCKIRERSRALLQSFLPLSLADAIEMQIFKHCTYKCGPGAYNNKIKACYVNLRRNEPLRQLLLSGFYTPREFVTLKHDEMLLPHEAAYTKALRAEAVRNSYLREPAADVHGIFTCSCGCSRQWRRRKLRAGSHDIAKASEILVCCSCTKVVDVLDALSNRIEFHRTPNGDRPKRENQVAEQSVNPPNILQQNADTKMVASPLMDAQSPFYDDSTRKPNRRKMFRERLALEVKSTGTSRSSISLTTHPHLVTSARFSGRTSGTKRTLLDSMD